MRKNRHMVPGGGRNLGRVGALGIVLAGALTAAILSVAIRVPPAPVDPSEIPQVQLSPDAPVRGNEAGRAHEGAATTRTARREARRESRRRDRSRRRNAGGERREHRASGSAVPVRYDGGGSSSGPPADTQTSGGGAPPVSTEGGGAPPAPRGIARGGGERSGPPPGERIATPPQSPAPAPAPAPAPVPAEPADDDDDFDDDDDVPGAIPAINAPTPEGDDDSADG